MRSRGLGRFAPPLLSAVNWHEEEISHLVSSTRPDDVAAAGLQSGRRLPGLVGTRQETHLGLLWIIPGHEADDVTPLDMALGIARVIEDLREDAWQHDATRLESVLHGAVSGTPH